MGGDAGVWGAEGRKGDEEVMTRTRGTEMRRMKERVRDNRSI